MTIRISIDAMGGDFGPEVTVAAAARALARHDRLELVLIGDETRVLPELSRHGLVHHARASFEHAPQVVEMHERPSAALRGKRESSMRHAIDKVRAGEAAASVSAGNTGALMAIARFVLKTLPGIDRPAICSSLPGLGQPTHMLDLGANVDSSSAELFRFAAMGAVLAEAVDNRSRPRVALLNVGEEEIKGNDRVKQTALLLEQSPLNYVGFAEGNDIFSGKFDVIVCDGFVGNVALKASEGVARMLTEIARQEFKRNLLTKLGALCALPALKGLRNRADPRRYNGASLVGLRGTVIKSHGSADVLSFTHAIDVAIVEAEKAVPERISHLLENMLEIGEET
ncbi:MAG: phosphate acyltransferase PlsX [Gammaproteobacteria bacterium]